MESFDKSIHDMRTGLKKFQRIVGEKHCGVATHIIDPHNFYIVPLMCYRLMPLLEQMGGIRESVQTNETVIYSSPALKEYVRGVVQKILPNDGCKIKAIDYGMTEYVNRDVMFYPHYPEALSMPPMALLCELTQCYPRGSTNFSEDHITAFKTYMGVKEKLTVTIMDNDEPKLGVHVMSSQSYPYNISTIMALNNLTVYMPP